MAMLGLDSPLLRWMMSGAQTKANKAPVNTMGVGAQSGAQRAATGNKALKERESQALANARVGQFGKKDKKGNLRGVAASFGRARGRGDAVQLPIEVPEEELGLEDPQR